MIQRPTVGSAIVARGTFGTMITGVWISAVWTAITMTDMANSLTILDSMITDVYGPYGIYAGGASRNHSRIDILQISRLTTNNNVAVGTNSSCVWIDIGAGANTVRLDNVGLINGGTGVRMSSPTVDPAGFSPGRPLFLLANDLEVDFPSRCAVELAEGEEAQLSNCYLQGAGAGNPDTTDPATGVGLYVGPRWSSELMVTNTRIFGHHAAGILLAGGAHSMITNNVIGMNNIGRRNSSGVLIKAGVSDFALHSNHVGVVLMNGPNPAARASTRYGIEIEPGSSNRYAIVGNTLLGNQVAGIFDGGTGKNKAVEANV